VKLSAQYGTGSEQAPDKVVPEIVPLAHEPPERVSVAALEGMLDVCFALLEEAAAD
jgi:hypothetical protein